MTEFKVRPAVDADRLPLSKLMQYETHVHRHLDWHTPVEWIGWTPFLVAVDGEKIIAALSCPMDLPGVAWIRLYAAVDAVSNQYAWDLLWKEARAVLSYQPGSIAAAIPLNPWMVELLSGSGFSHSNDVIILKWESGMRAPAPRSGASIRTMHDDDIAAVYHVDSLAFQPIWQNSLASLKVALTQAVVATVAEDDSGIVGYQISTSSHMGGHIARLAVLPHKQGQNLGYALVFDVLRQLERRMVFQVTVNTQRDNLVSQNLYLKAGFRKTGEVYPVYQTQAF